MILKCEIESLNFPTFFDWLLFIPWPRPLNCVNRNVNHGVSNVVYDAAYEKKNKITSTDLLILKKID